MRPNRRSFLKHSITGLAGTLAPAGLSFAQAPRGRGEEDPNLFVFPRLKFESLTHKGDLWNAHPDADEKFLNFLKTAINIKLSAKPWHERNIDIRELGRAYSKPEEKSRIYHTPFLFMTGEGKFLFQPNEAATLGEYFKRGGFLYADDCSSGGTGDYLYQCFIKEIQKALPGHKMEPVPFDHEINHCRFDFPNGAPRCRNRKPHRDMGLFYKGRLVAFLTNGDLHCGWANRFYGSDSQRVADTCYKMGTNIVLYALTH